MIDDLEIDALMESTAGVVREYLSAEIGRLRKDFAHEVQQMRAEFEARLKAIPAGPRGDTGPQGAKGDPGERGANGEKGMDGKDGRDGRDGIAGKDGRDGEAGRDALQIDILPEIDPAKSYARGTVATHNGGLWWAFRNTKPGDMADWMVVSDGTAAIDEIPTEDPRDWIVEFRRASGAKTVVSRHYSVPDFRGIYQDGTEYRRGECVQYGGSVWMVRTAATKSKPTEGHADWVLSVKRGRDGKDGKDGQKGDPGPEGRPGKDLTQIARDGSKH